MRKNVVLLFLAFGLGQGVLFLAQSWMIARGELALVGRFGAVYLLISLAYYIVDWGGMVVLARRELTARCTGETDRFFWNLTAFRIIVACAFSIGLVGWATVAPRFEAAYLIASLPALWVGAFNFGGILDGAHRSGLNGITAAVPMIISGLLLPATEFMSPSSGGAMLGGAYAIGMVAGTAMQVGFLKKAGRLPVWHRLSLPDMLAAMREGWLILLTLLPSYTFYRGQVAVSSAVLGPAATGLFVYSKQVVNAVIICNQLVRRAEFPALVQAVSQPIGRCGVLKAQRATLTAGLLMASGMVFAVLFAWLFVDGELAAAAILTASFAPVILASALYSAMHQAYLAAARPLYAVGVGTGCVLGGIALCVLGAGGYGVYGFIVAETIMNVAGFVALLSLWGRVIPHSQPGGSAETASSAMSLHKGSN